MRKSARNSCKSQTLLASPAAWRSRKHCGTKPNAKCGKEKDFVRFSAADDNTMMMPELPFSSMDLTVSDFQQFPVPAFLLTPAATASNLEAAAEPMITDHDDYQSGGGDSFFETLPFDVLVQILCCLHHDELKPLFRVSKRFKKAVQSARQSHFDFTTPDRERNRCANFLTPRQSNHSFLFSRQKQSDILPPTPSAPKHAAKPAHVDYEGGVDVKKIAVMLFQAPTAEKSHLKIAPASRNPRRRHISHRVLFA